LARSPQLRNWIGESRTRCSWTAIVLKASEEALRESSVLLATTFAALERAERRRRASAAGDGDIRAEAFSTLIRLQDIGRRFIREHDADALINALLDTATNAASTDLGNVQLLDPSRRTLQIVAQRGFGPEFLEFFHEVHGAAAACGAAMRAGRQVIVEDVTTHPIFVGQRSQDVLLRAGVRAVQSTPLIAPSGELVGMLSTHFRSRHRVPAYRLRLIDIISRRAAELIRDVHARHRAIGTA
jgi:GAF domain-containing protein